MGRASEVPDYGAGNVCPDFASCLYPASVGERFKRVPDVFSGMGRTCEKGEGGSVCLRCLGRCIRSCPAAWGWCYNAKKTPTMGTTEEGGMADNRNEPIRLDRLSDRFFKYLFAFGHCTVSPQRKNDFPIYRRNRSHGASFRRKRPTQHLQLAAAESWSSAYTGTVRVHPCTVTRSSLASTLSPRRRTVVSFTSRFRLRRTGISWNGASTTRR